MRKRLVKVNFFLLIISLISFSPLELTYPQAPSPEAQMIESLEFREVDIKDVLRQLSKQYNLNIVFSEKVAGLVTVQLSNVTVAEAMDSIITVNGFAYTRKDDIIKVTSLEEAQAEGKQTKLFRLNNADATKLKESLAKVLSPDGSIEADGRSNSLIVTDTLSVINKIEEAMPHLDSLTAQVLIETKLIETSLTKTDKLGIDWTTTLSATGSKRPTTLPFPPKGDRSWMENVFPPNPATSPDFPSGHPFAFPIAVKGDFTLGTLDATSLRAIFDVLKSRTNTRLIANPRIVTLNNQKALIHVGRNVPIPTYERNETTGKMEIIGWEEPEKVGVQLEVTPQISPDGHIKLKLRPEVSSIVDFIKIGGENAAPITATRTVETEVLMQDGQTVVIGGLIKDESFTKISKIPILGDIPLLGFFFTRKELGSSTNPTEKTDLLIFVTATIIKDTDEPLLAHESNLIVSMPRPFKLEMRPVK
jgi:type IV pilus assembly protein PilQ